MKTLTRRWLMLVALLLGLHAQAAPILYLQPARQIADPNAPVVMDLLIRDLDFPAVTLGGFDVTLSYDSDFLRLASIEFSTALGNAAQRVEQIAEDPGTDPASLRLFVVSLLEAAPDGCFICSGPYLADLQAEAFRLATLSFDWVHDGPGTTMVGFLGAQLSDGLGENLAVGALLPAQVEIPAPGSLALVVLGLWAMCLAGRRAGTARRVRRGLLLPLAALLAAGPVQAQPVRPGTGQPFLLVVPADGATLDAYFIRDGGTPEPAVAVGGTPNGAKLVEMAIADFDGDGALDFVAATNEDPARLYLYRRTGARTFAAAVPVGTLERDPKAMYYLAQGQAAVAPDYGMGLVAADVDRDGDVDLLENVNHEFAPGLFWIARGNTWINNGSGTFTKKPDTFDFAEIHDGWTLGMSTTLADLNDDTIPDMLVSSQANGGDGPSPVYALFGRGDGTFGPPVYRFTAPHPATFISLGSLDNDGTVDALTGMDDDGDTGQVYGFLRAPDWTFGAPFDAFDTNPAIELGADDPGGGRFQLYDVTGDGILDAVASPSLATPGARLEYYEGLGDGGFGAARELVPHIFTNTGFVAPEQPLDPRWPAFIVAATGGTTLDAYFTIDGIRYGAPVPVAESLTGVPQAETAVADFDGDGQIDIIAATNQSSACLAFYRRTGPRTFEVPSSASACYVMDEDPKAEYQYAQGRRELAPDYGLGLIAVDLDNDGDVDLLEALNSRFGTPEQGLFWIARGNAWLNDGHGNFPERIRNAFDFSSIWTGWALGMSTTLGDLNGDGFPDMLASEQASGADVQSRVYALYGRGDGTFGAPVLVFTAPHPATFLGMGDVNNDGATDALVGMDDDGDPGQVYVFFGEGDGTFYQEPGEAFDTAPAAEAGVDGPGSGKFQLVDMTGDGVLDVVAGPAPALSGALPPGRLEVYRGLGNGRYQLLAQVDPGIHVSTGFSAPYARPVFPHLPYDFNGDGNTDLDDLAYLTGPAQPAMRPRDPLDLNGDGIVNVADARRLILRCTLPGCTRLP